ncbi:MAG: nucleoside triphosphate pyrophosphohydrolase [Chromatiales bacterium 21-64-14]|nr:MAG: nucleoside triphosphate pyrophosphohydrolase [Chromatiales bacterium 21-64-14]HQU15905.1 nucleoside triphosphate pyrophosphohydrolase [Gammaproteobacteria bacterium]
MDTHEPVDPLARLLHIMARLRDPDAGCPWDRRQTFATIAPYTLEEAYEVADAVERGDLGALRSELGDLLYQVVYHARMAEEAGAFTFADVAQSISDKLTHRHPEIFGAAAGAVAPAERRSWEDHKLQERKAGAGTDPSALADIARALPALMRALKLQNRAARTGFDWPGLDPVLEKMEEELDELREAASAPDTAARVFEEVGDLLFTGVNLARHTGADPEAALRAANGRFEARFRYVEDRLRERSRRPEDTTPEELDSLWEEAKRHLTARSDGP